MKTKRSYLLIFILSLSLTLILKESNLFFDTQEKNLELNREPRLSAPSSLEAVWYRTWGGDDYDGCILFEKDSEDNLYLAGQTSSFGMGGVDICLVKYNNVGKLQWNRTWGGKGNEKLYPIAIDSLNNVYLTGIANVTGGTRESFIIRYDSSGDLRWVRTWGGNETYNPRSIACDSANNIYFIGTIDDIIILKYNITGDLQWSRTWGGNESDSPRSIAFDSLNNIYVIGSTMNYGAGEGDGIILKYNSSGDLQWTRIWGGNETDYSRLIAVDSFDNIYVAGNTDDSKEKILIKYDTTGTQLWNRTWGRFEDGFIEFNEIVLDSFEDIYIAGRIIRHISDGESYWSYIFLDKFDNSGLRLWNETWGSETINKITDIEVDSLNNIYLVGTTTLEIIPYTWYQKDIFLLKYDSSGSLISNSSWGGDEDEYCAGIALDSSENIFIGGSTRSFGVGETDICLVKFVEKSEPIILGYDFLLLILILSVVSIITIISRLTKTLIKKK